MTNKPNDRTDTQIDFDEVNAKKDSKVEETDHEFDTAGDMPIISEKQARRLSRMSYEQRVQRYIEATEGNGYFNPDLCEKREPPPESIIAMKDELGEDFIKAHGLVLLYHFWFKRWVVAQEATDGKGHRGFRIVYMCQGDRIPGYIPPDLDDDAHFDILVGAIGDYRVPNRWDFRMLKERLDPRVYGTQAERTRNDAKKVIDKEAAFKKDFMNWTEGYMDHYGSLWIQGANQAAGSMQGLNFVPGTSLEQLRKEREAKFHFEPVYNEAGEFLYRRVKAKNFPFKEPEGLRFPIDIAVMRFVVNQAYGENHRDEDAIDRLQRLCDDYKAKVEAREKTERRIWHEALLHAQEEARMHKDLSSPEAIHSMDKLAVIELLEPDMSMQEREAKERKIASAYAKLAKVGA